MPPPALSFDEPPREAASATPPAEESPAVSLTRPAVGPLRDAALDIRDAARSMDVETSVAAPVAAATPEPEPRPSAIPGKSVPVDKEPKAPHAAAAGPRPAPRAETRAVAAYPLLRGSLAGLLAGLAVGGGLWGAAGWLEASSFAWLTAPLFSWTTPLLPEPAWRLTLFALAGLLSGTIAAGAGSPGRHDAPLSIPRCAGSALLPGVLLGMLAILTPSVVPEGPAVWPAVNWMRDLLLVGLLTPALNRVFPGER
jgi:hypothetical protein